MSSEPDTPRPFRYDAQVDPGEKRHFHYETGETYLGRPVEVPVTVVVGERPGPRLCLTAAVHGDEVNGVAVLQAVADRYDPTDLHGTIVCVHVVNVPGYVAQQRYIPIYDQDLNRAFPGSPTGSTAARMANVIFERFVRRCDVGLDFHTSTRNRMTVFHARADVEDEGVRRLVEAFGAPLVMSSRGSSGMLRRVATEAGVPTATIEMGEANRVQPGLVELGLQGVENVLDAYGMYPAATPVRSEYCKVVTDADERKWIRSDYGGLVEMKWGPYPIVEAGETICVISDHFNTEQHVVTAPFTGYLAGILANPRVLPGHPLVNLIGIDEADREAAVRLFDRYGFSRHGRFHWMGRTDGATTADRGPGAVPTPGTESAADGDE